MRSRDELLSQIQQRPDIVLLMEELQAMLDQENKNRVEFRNQIHKNRSAEFINGKIIDHSPVGGKPWRVCGRIVARLSNHVEENNLGKVNSIGKAGVEKVMIELTRNDYEPDIVFFNTEKSSQFTDNQLRFPAPDFIAEILSDHTEEYDRNEKFIDYAAHGVYEYWIIDLEFEIIEQYLNENGAFILFQKLNQGLLESKVIPEFVIDLADIFDLEHSIYLD